MTVKPNYDLVLLKESCVQNFIEVYDGSTSTLNKRLQICKSETNKYFKSETNRVFLRYTINKNSLKEPFYFKLNYNQFKPGK